MRFAVAAQTEQAQSEMKRLTSAHVRDPRLQRSLQAWASLRVLLRSQLRASVFIHTRIMGGYSYRSRKRKSKEYLSPLLF